MLRDVSRCWMWQIILPGLFLLTGRISAEAVRGALPALFLVTAADRSSWTCSLHVLLGALLVSRHPSGLYFRGIKTEPTRVI